MALVVEDLEKAGPRKTAANVNTDNTTLFFPLETRFGGTSWWTHAKSAAKNKDGRATWFALELNLRPTSVMDQADIKNKANIQLLCYRGETR